MSTERPGWREYQSKNKKSSGIKHRGMPHSHPWAIIIAVVLVMFGLFYAGFSAFSSTSPSQPKNAPGDQSAAVTQVPPAVPTISKKDAQVLLSQLSLDQLLAEQATMPFKGQDLKIKTSLDMELQSYLINAMDLKNSRYIGIVVMEADTGRILVLAGFDKTDGSANPCLHNSFPAASLFKIVTAAAAVDQCHYSANTRLKFNGYKHTLYKNQLKDRTNQYTNTVSFKDAFAQSINPVFGKIGTLRLGKTKLEQSATAFGFNQPIDFELAVIPSRFIIKDDPYHWAEIASGFNNDTTISPLHGAMMVTAVLNKGRILAPTIVDRINDTQDQLLYQSDTQWHGRAMSTQAAGTLVQMMETTVLSGTGRKTFKGLRSHRTLSHLQIGGKTGSIFNRAHDVRFDWFVGFAKEKKGPGRLAISVLVAHEEYIGIRAGQYARMAMTRFFESQLAHRTTTKIKTGS